MSDTKAKVIICGIDHGSRDITVQVLGHLTGHKPTLIIIDDIQPMLGRDIIDIYEPLHPEEDGLVMKNGKLIRRHHPIPKTPKSPRQSRRG